MSGTNTTIQNTFAATQNMLTTTTNATTNTQTLKDYETRLEIQELKAILNRVPGMPQQFEKTAPTLYFDSPFCREIATVLIPKRFSVPSMKYYDGSGDPYDHVAAYKGVMMTVPLQADIAEACMCKGFGSTLTGPALRWFTNLPNGTITSFAHLVDLFKIQFASSRKLEKQSGDLYRIVQKPWESLREYMQRFTMEMISIKDCDTPTAVNAYKIGLKNGSELYIDLTKYPCRTFEEVMAKTMAQVRVEEDPIRGKQAVDYDRTDRKMTIPKKTERDRPYSRPGGDRVNAVNWKDDPSLPPKLSEYDLKGGIQGLMKALGDLGNAARWPKKSDRPIQNRDRSLWCEYHRDIGHRTEDCVNLRREVHFQLQRGNLREVVLDCNITEAVPRPPSPKPDRVVNFISGGDAICGVTYSSAKRRAKESKMTGRYSRVFVGRKCQTYRW